MDVTQGHVEATRLITDAAAAADLALVTTLAVQEAQSLAALYQEREIKPPWPIPSDNTKGTPWFLDEARPGAAWGSARVFSPLPYRRIEIDLRSPSLSLYNYQIRCEAGEASQSIVVAADGSVETNYYAFRIQAQNFDNALNLVLGLATAVYRSRQFDTGKELGPLLCRQSPTDQQDWSLLRRTRQGFTAPAILPEAQGHLILASAKSVFESEGFAQPVLALEIQPSRKGKGTYQVEVLLHRPPERPTKLMPLAKHLQHVLWKPIFDSIFK